MNAIQKFALALTLATLPMAVHAQSAPVLSFGGYQVVCLGPGQISGNHPFGFRFFDPLAAVIEDQLHVTVFAEFLDCARHDVWERIEIPHARRLHFETDQNRLLDWYDGHTASFEESKYLSYVANAQFKLSRLLTRDERARLDRGESVSRSFVLRLENAGSWDTLDQFRLSPSYYTLSLEIEKSNDQYLANEIQLTFHSF